jgi:hypothetical protein
MAGGDVEELLGSPRHLRPNLWTKHSQVVPDKKAPITLVLVTLGSSLHYQQKHWMYSWRVLSSFCQ